MMRTGCGLAACLLLATTTTSQVRADGDGFVQEGRHHRATFDRHAATLTHSTIDGDDACLQLRLTWHRRAGASRSVDETTAPHPTQAGVEYLHADVAERYRTTASGFEQSFRFVERPTGSGDLVLGIRTAGNVNAPATETRAHRPIYFHHDDRAAIRYGEAIAIDRTGKRIDVATEYDGNGMITLTVPGRFVDDATYPLLVDPVVGPVRNPGGASANDTVPAVASNVAGSRHLVVWLRTLASTSSVCGQMLDENGAPVGPVISYATEPNLREPTVAFYRGLTNDAFVVVWGKVAGLRGRLVDAGTGLPLAANFDITNTIGTGSYDARPSVSGGESLATVAWERVIDFGIESRILVCAIHWPNPNAPALEIVGPEHTIEHVTAGHVRQPRITNCDLLHAVNGQHVYLNRIVWDRWWTSPAPGDYDVRTASFYIHPVTLFRTYVQLPTGVAGASSIGVDEFHADVAVRAPQYVYPQLATQLVVWEQGGDVHGHRYGPWGPEGVSFPIRATSKFEGFPSVGAGSCDFTVAYAESTPPDEFDVDIYAARVQANGTVASDHRLVDDPGPSYQGGVRVSSRPVHTAYEHEHNTSMITWWGQTGPAGGINDVRARLFEAVTTSMSPFGVGCPGPIGELPTIGTAGGPPTANNGNFALTVTNAPATTLAVLLISNQLTTTPIPGAPGCSLYAGLPMLTALPLVTTPSGTATSPLPMPCSLPGGTTLAFQWAFYTPGHNAFGWIVSDDLDIAWVH